MTAQNPINEKSNLNNTVKTELFDKTRSHLFTPSPVYKPFRYQWAYDAWQKQQDIHWNPKEIIMNDDITDWKFKLTDGERDLLTNIFRIFTQLDIEVNDCYMSYYQTLFEPTEIKMMLSAFSNMETIHTVAYDHLIETVGMKESEYKAFLTCTEMKVKWDYMQKYGDRSIQGIAMTIARFSAFSEGLQLFSAFAILMNFSRFNKMKGMSQIVSWSIRDETLHVESLMKLFHEVLKDYPEVKTEEFYASIIDECKIVIAQEDNFIDFIFKDKVIEGVSAESTKQYIRYIANRRLSQLGCKTIYKVEKNPYDWMEIMQNEFTNFFENKPSEYSLYSPKDNVNWDQAFNKALKKN